MKQIDVIEFYAQQIRLGKTHDEVMRRIQVEDVYYNDVFHTMSTITINGSDQRLDYRILPETKMINGVECDMHVTSIDNNQAYYAEHVVTIGCFCSLSNGEARRLMPRGVVYDSCEKAAKACRARYEIKVK